MEDDILLRSGAWLLIAIVAIFAAAVAADSAFAIHMGIAAAAATLSAR